MQENILDDSFSTIEFSDLKFTGKLMGKSWKHEQCTDHLKKVRYLLFLFPLLFFYPIVTNYLFHDMFSKDLFIERLIFAAIFILSGIFFNKYRLAALIFPMLPSILMMLYLIMIGYFAIRLSGFYLAVIFILGVGIFYHFREKKLRNELIDEFKSGNTDAILITKQ